MAMGIDDIIVTAAAGINLTDTVVQTVKRYRKSGRSIDIERLIEEVRVTALQRIDEADHALMAFERTLVETDVDLDQTLTDVIQKTPWWRPDQAHRMKRFRQSFNALSDAAYSACDDIAALVRCRDDTGLMGVAIIETAAQKHNFNRELLESPSIRDAIAILRNQLAMHKAALA